MSTFDKQTPGCDPTCLFSYKWTKPLDSDTIVPYMGAQKYQKLSILIRVTLMSF